MTSIIWFYGITDNDEHSIWFHRITDDDTCSIWFHRITDDDTCSIWFYRITKQGKIVAFTCHCTCKGHNTRQGIPLQTRDTTPDKGHHYKQGTQHQTRDLPVNTNPKMHVLSKHMDFKSHQEANWHPQWFQGCRKMITHLKEKVNNCECNREGERDKSLIFCCCHKKWFTRKTVPFHSVLIKNKRKQHSF